MRKFTSLLLVFCLFTGLSTSQKKIEINTDQLISDISPMMWGIFFEDINFGADGGLNAELVKNGSFEFYTPLMGWIVKGSGRPEGKVELMHSGTNRNNPRYLSLINPAASSGLSLRNEGFRGMGIRKNETYLFSVKARRHGAGMVHLFVVLEDSSGNTVAKNTLSDFGEEWNTYTLSLTSSITNPNARLILILQGEGQLDIDLVSLFPRKTWKERPMGLRADLVQVLADLKPGFIRFPGGCIVEGREIATRYQWKNTIGKREDRPLSINRWNAEFPHRSTPDYFQSFALGFYEYFQLAEDMGAEPLPIINCGMACQFNTSELIPLNELDPYIQDALDLIEFANGPASSRWGKIRDNMGHPEPFNLKYLGVGNEQWGSLYVERYKIFEKAIRAKYPDMQLVTSAGPYPDGELYNYLRKEMLQSSAALIDEHYYRSPDWFLSQAARYDTFSTTGPKVFAGEYASHGPLTDAPTSANSWLSALTEAAFMTGLERNAAKVRMCSYAPLLANVSAWQWRPDLIWFNNLEVVLTPNYYVQQLFSTHRGTHVVSATCEGKDLTGQDSLYASAVIDKNAGKLYFKLVNVSAKNIQVYLSLKGKKSFSEQVSTISLTGPELLSCNSFDNKQVISPQAGSFGMKGRNVSIKIAPQSFVLYEFAVK